MPPASAESRRNRRELGFRIEDVKVILNSHVHYDHAGGIAELQRLSGAKVWASAPSAQVLKNGQSGPDDPQFGALPPIGKVADVQVFKDGQTLRVGPLAVTAHLTPVAAPEYKFTQHAATLKSFEKSFRTLAALRCDILITLHPQASDLWTRIAKRDADHSSAALVAADACERYVATTRDLLRARVTTERTK